MTNMYKIDLDIAHDFYDTALYNHDLAEFNITHELIELEGPAGGNPYVWLKGTPKDLNKLLDRWAFAASEIEDMMENSELV